jgi:uncharacterized membrane protein YqjE
MADDNPSGSKGLFESLSTLASTVVGAAHTRLELLSTDIEEDRAHLLSQVCLYVSALFCLAVGLILLVILLMLAFWDTHRLIALAVLAGVFLLISVMAWGYARHKAKTKPKLFLASLMELLKDWQSLGPR